ncbi:MAG: 3-coathanger stack domain-containing protein [Bacteroidota bacterium]
MSTIFSNIPNIRRLILWSLAILSVQIVFAQNDPPLVEFDSEQEAVNHLFSQMNPSNYPSGILYDRVLEGSSRLLKPTSGLTSAITKEDWCQAYYEILLASEPDSALDKMISFYQRVNWKLDSRFESDEIPVAPIALLAYNYHAMKPDAYENNLIDVDMTFGFYREVPGVGANLYDAKRVFAAMPLLPDIESGTVRYVLDNDFLRTNLAEVPSSIRVDFGDGMGMRTMYWGNEVVVNYSVGGTKTVRVEANYTHGLEVTESTFEYNPSNLARKKQGDVDFDDKYTVTTRPDPDFKTGYSRFHFNTIKARVGVKYGCPDKKVRKPIIFVTGFTPSNFGIGLVEGPNAKVRGYNQSGMIDDLVAKGYDVYVVVWKNGDDYVINNSRLLEKFIREINIKKRVNGSQFENLIISWSLGALTARHTLLKMENDFYESGSVNAHHHARLYVSMEGEHQGANIVLGAQHMGLSSPIVAPIIGGILNSPTAREILLYHHSKTGNKNNPGQGADDARQDYIDYMDSIEHQYVKMPGVPYPGDTRNVGIAVGSHENNDTYNLAGGYNMLYVKSNLLAGPHKSEREHNAVGDDEVVFLRDHKPFRLFTIRIKTKKTNSQAVELDNVPGSFGGTKGTQSWHVLISNVITFNPANSGFYNKQQLDSFNPTIGALDIRETGIRDFSYDINQLLVTAPGQSSGGGGDTGFPHLVKPIYTATPFDAIHAPSDNYFHGPGQTDAVWKDFILDEIMADNLQLQNRQVGEVYERKNSPFRFLADFEATETIEAGKALNYRTPQQDFVVKSNAGVRMRAGNEITFKPGFEAEYGSELYAEINGTCAGVYNTNRRAMAANPNYEPQEEPVEEEEVGFDLEEEILAERLSMKVVPNPSYGKARILLQLPQEARLQIRLLDMNGRPVKVLANGDDFYAGYQEVGFETRSLQSGMYICEVFDGTQRTVQKLMVLN